MNFILEIINDLSFIFIILAYFGALSLMGWAPYIFNKMSTNRYRVITLLVLFLILITLLAIAGMMITY